MLSEICLPPKDNYHMIILCVELNTAEVIDTKTRRAVTRVARGWWEQMIYYNIASNNNIMCTENH
jgi:hypothetical protein